MKFRAKTCNDYCMRRLAILVSLLAKLGKQCVLSLRKDELCFLIFDEGILKRPLAWCTLQKDEFFTEYNIIGVSDDANQISLQFSPEMFARALAPLQSNQMDSLKIKLTKKRLPCLTCEIEMTTEGQHLRTCIHDIPVEIVSRKFWPDLAIPQDPNFDVSLVIKKVNMKRFRTACERMKTLGSHIIVEGRKDGILALKSEKDLGTITTYFKELFLEKKDDDGSDSEEFYSVKVDFKKVINFLSIDALCPKKIICNIMDRRLLSLYVPDKDLKFNYCIPGIDT